jgi:divalent metal cation (Fe/Co/Zn/Cd) transporter
MAHDHEHEHDHGHYARAAPAQHPLMPAAASAGSATQRMLTRRGLTLEYITLVWNIAGTAVSITAAVAAGSVALAGFGLDSLVEIGASTTVIWQLNQRDHAHQRRALRLIGAAFIGLALYIAAQGIYILIGAQHPRHSPLGMVWTAVTCLAMLALAAAKTHTGKALQNPVLLTEGRVTLIDAYLAGAIVIGLALNATLGWWWADPFAGFIIVFYGLREGRHALSEA